MLVFQKHPARFLRVFLLISPAFLLTMLMFHSTKAGGQSRQKHFTVAIFNANNALPLARFSRLFGAPLHPGVEAGAGINWSTKRRHDWFQALKPGYFYHRFVQHGIPFFTEFGYRYKFGSSFSAETAIGAGYMHSIPAVSVSRLDSEGDYKNGKGWGRSQATVTGGLGVGYNFDFLPAKSGRVFVTWQQRLQLPFNKSYVPVLPYNNLILGISFPIAPKTNSL